MCVWEGGSCQLSSYDKSGNIIIVFADNVAKDDSYFYVSCGEFQTIEAVTGLDLVN